MVVNFRARGISLGTRELTRTSILIKKNHNLVNLIKLSFNPLKLILKSF